LLFIDIKFLNMISHRIPGFQKKSEYLWNCRCLICGDSATNKRKKRGYFYRADNHIQYKCHNCLVSMPFALFLRDHGDGGLYDEYRLERYLERKPPTRPVPTGPVPLPKRKPTSHPLNALATRVSKLAEDHPAVVYLTGRKIPGNRFTDLWFLPETKDIVSLCPRYEGRLVGSESRVVFPLYDETGTFAGVGMRAIENRPDIKRYVNIKFDQDNPHHLFFGLPTVDPTQRVYVVEGAMDSLFLPNAIAANTSDFSSVKYLGFPDVVYIWDNQPRNKEVCKIQEKMIRTGIHTVIWPSRVVEKDINEMVLAGRDVQSIVDANVVSDVEAILKFSDWKKC
jgi:hypothetical protein